jgi:hypothetical protein
LLNVRPDKDLAETVQSESEQEFSRLLLTRNKG